MNPHNINHLLTLATASENMPSPGVESRLLATIAAQQKRIDALEAALYRVADVVDDDDYNDNYGVALQDIQMIAKMALKGKEETK